MRFLWIVSILSTLVSMGLLVIIAGQYQVLVMLDKGSEKLQMVSQELDNERANKETFKVTVKKLLVQRTKVVQDLEAELAKLSPELEKKKTENDACQAEKKTKTGELASVEKKHTETEATLEAESDAWKDEIISLRRQLTGYRLICDHVKKDPLALKFCGNKTS